MQTTMTTSANTEFSNNDYDYGFQKNKTYSTTNLSYNALYIINSHYKDNSILIQYANENISYDLGGNEMKTGSLQVILHIGYKIDKQTNICIPVFQYDTFHFEYITGKECIPEYCIDKTATKYHNIVNKELF